MKDLGRWASGHRWGLVGALVGFTVAAAILAFGFLRALVLAAFTLAGYLVGRMYSRDGEYLRKVLDRILPPGHYR
ncbi:MAG: DUF2273 domain-containing protein [Oscillospiraceae bacterium]|nr:DUF2273 domain-containing protein [Oscillospiraceae bacterium]